MVNFELTEVTSNHNWLTLHNCLQIEQVNNHGKSLGNTRYIIVYFSLRDWLMWHRMKSYHRHAISLRGRNILPVKENRFNSHADNKINLYNKIITTLNSAKGSLLRLCMSKCSIALNICMAMLFIFDAMGKLMIQQHLNKKQCVCTLR